MSTTVQRARTFALMAHGDQRYGDEPYAVHLDAVARLVRTYGEEAQVVAYLHDVVEDTQTPLDRVRAEFGEHVARCVALVTDVPGADRADRKAKTNAKLAEADDSLRAALIVKAADRLANVRASVQIGSLRHLRMYAFEHAAFRIAAYRPGLCDVLWDELNQLIAQQHDNAAGIE